MDADLEQAQAHQFNQVGGGGGGGGSLTRYKSAPSSYFSNFVMEYKDVSDFLRPPPPKPLSPQIDRIFAQLASEMSGDHDTAATTTTTPVMKLEIEPEPGHVMAPAYTPSAALPPPHPLSRTSSGVNSAYRGLKSSAPPPPVQVRIPVVEKQSSGSNLTRHSSLPAGLFSQIDVHNVAAAYFSGGSGTNQTTSSSDMMSAYSAIGNDDMKQSSSNDAVIDPDDYMLNGFWNDESSTEKLLTGVKRERAEDEFVEDGKPFSGESNIPAREMKKSGMLSHHLSLPKSSMEILSAMEKFLELQDSTAPVGVRAKRGCATHPRSIAERVRRTKISDRMRRLQELVPNMDKQTNTSDMLDLAVDYIKDLQQKVQILKACSERCTC